MIFLYFIQNIKWKYHKIQSLIIIKIHLSATVKVWVIYPAAGVFFFKKYVCVRAKDDGCLRTLLPVSLPLCCFRVRRRPTRLAFTRGAILCWLHGCAFSHQNPTRLRNFATRTPDFSRVTCNIRDAWRHLLLPLFFYQLKGKVNSSYSFYAFPKKKWHRWEENYTSLTPPPPPFVGKTDCKPPASDSCLHSVKSVSRVELKFQLQDI